MKDMLRNSLRYGAAGIVLLFGLAIAANAQTSGATNQASLNDTSLAGALARYREYTKYPPESRPLHASNWDLLHPWTVDTATLPLTPDSWKAQLETMMKSGVPRTEIAQRIGTAAAFPTYNFAVNKLILAGTRDELIARLTVSPAPGTADLHSFHIVKAELIGDMNFGSPNLGSVPYSCDPGATPQCTFTWKAPDAEKQYWGALQLKVTVALQGQGNDYVALLHFYSSPMVPGRFTGSFQERLENGSLMIDAGVKVQKRMACFVSANLFSADKEIPTHHAERRMIVDPSMSVITFTFFGKIFRDNGYEGTFRIQDLKAQCENLPYPPEWFMDSSAHLADLEQFQNQPSPGPEPGSIYFEYNNFTFTTRGHPISDFSDAEWQAPERTQKLDLLNKAAQQPVDPATLEILKRPSR